MSTIEFYTFTQAGRMLGMTRQEVAGIVRVMGMPTASRGFPGTARWLTREQVEEIAERLGIEVRELEAVTV